MSSNVWSDACGAYPLCDAFSGARGATSTSGPGGRRTGISSRGARLGQGGDAGRAGHASRLDKANGTTVGGDREVGRGRRTTLDGQPSGPTPAEQNGAPRTTARRPQANESANGTEAAKARHDPRLRSAQTVQRVPPKGLRTVRDHVFQKRQRGQLYNQLPKLLRTSHEPRMRRDAQIGCRRTQSHALKATRSRGRKGHKHTRDQKTTGGREPEGPGRAARGQHARIYRALLFQISRVMLE